MCYYIGIEDLAANALIELVDKKKSREVSFQTLNNYGMMVVENLRANNKEAILLLSRDKTNEFIHNCTDFFEIKDSKEGSSICLKAGVETDTLREYFRTSISLNVLLAFISDDSLRVLGVA